MPFDLRRWLGIGSHTTHDEAEASCPAFPTELQSRDDVIAAVMELREQLGVVERTMREVQQSVTQCEDWLRVYGSDTQALLAETEAMMCELHDTDAAATVVRTQEGSEATSSHANTPNTKRAALTERYDEIRRSYAETTYSIRRRILQLRVRLHTMARERAQVKHNLYAVMARYDIAPDEVYVVPPSPIALSFAFVPRTP